VAREQWAHEGPLVAEHATAFVPNAIRFDEIEGSPKQTTVFLVGGEAGKAEQGEGHVAGPFGRQEIAIVTATVEIDPRRLHTRYVIGEPSSGTVV
jgi:hypothetical protein